MDYTLSQYRPETFEVLAYNLTIEKLVNNFKYPKVWNTHLLPMRLCCSVCGFQIRRHGRSGAYAIARRLIVPCLPPQ